MTPGARGDGEGREGYTGGCSDDAALRVEEPEVGVEGGIDQTCEGADLIT